MAPEGDTSTGRPHGGPAFCMVRVPMAPVEKQDTASISLVSAPRVDATVKIAS
jgi:hypothetical protein